MQGNDVVGSNGLENNARPVRMLFSHCTAIEKLSALFASIDCINNLLINTNLLHLIDDYKLYLYGHHTLTNHINNKILSSTISYIKDTGRFS